MAKKVFIGVGHGGSDPGAVANGFNEANLNLAIALACQDELSRHGVLTKISRTKDENDPLSEEIRECNAFNPDLAVEIHNNAGGGDGAEVYHSINGGTGATLAGNILVEIKKIGQNSRGAKIRKNSRGSDYYGWIRSTKAPAVIVECAFLDNKTDIQIIDTKAEQVAMGVAIAKGIIKTLEIEYKETVAPPAEPCNISIPTIKNGSEGETVRALQILLIGNGYDCGAWGADSKFGDMTAAALFDYQAEHDIPTTKECDTRTWCKLLGL